MMVTNFALLSTCLTTLASAWTTPVGSNPSGNPILKPLNEIVPVGQVFQIKWTPTSTGTVTLLLLRGPSTNVVPLKAIAENIENSGSYSWTPDSSLQADSSRYGIQLIQDSNGAFQYSTQFGISGGSGTGSSSSSSSVATGYSSSTASAATSYSSSSSSAATDYSSPSPSAAMSYSKVLRNATCTHCPGFNRNMTSLPYGTGTISSPTTLVKPTTSSNASTVSTTISFASSTSALITSAPTSGGSSYGSNSSASSAPARSSNAAVPQPVAAGAFTGLIMTAIGFFVTLLL